MSRSKSRDCSVSCCIYWFVLIQAWLPLVFACSSRHEVTPAAGSQGVILFATDGAEGIRAYSELTLTRVRTLICNSNPGEDGELVEGLTFDWINGRIYWASGGGIYTANERGTDLKQVFNSTESIKGLAFDWITGNLYGLSTRGYVFVCRAASSGQLSCTNLPTREILAGQGIALDPIHGKMYWTRGPAGLIMEAQMDGSDMIRLIDCNDPLGIAIDPDTSRIFWTEQENSRILSSDMNGTDIRTVVTLPRGSSPYGIAIHKNELYWGNWNDRSLQRSSKSGGNVRTLFRGAKTENIRHLCTTSRNFLTSRRNHCEGQNCSNICVLTATGFRCIP